jgi:Tfp pilus assembly protein PilP
VIWRAFLVGVVLIGLAPVAAQPPPGEASPALQPSGEPVPPVPAAPGPRDPGQKRDPFRPFTLDFRPQEVDEPVTPLQRYELSQLTLVAVMLEIEPPRAMLQDNSGMGFIVTPGTPIGRNHGAVKSIEPGKVTVEEKVLDFYGREQVRTAVLEIPRDEQVQSISQE